MFAEERRNFAAESTIAHYILHSKRMDLDIALLGLEELEEHTGYHPWQGYDGNANHQRGSVTCMDSYRS